MYKIKEIQDLFADAFVVDEGSLVFVSMYGRDTAIQQLFASFSLPIQNGGLDRITFEADGDTYEPVVGLIKDHSKLEKFTGRLPRENLFGNLSHVWIFDSNCVAPDRVTQSAWIFSKDGESLESIERRCWEITNLLSTVPLLDSWMTLLFGTARFIDFKVANGRGCVKALKLSLASGYENYVCDLIKAGTLLPDALAVPQADKAVTATM